MRIERLRLTSLASLHGEQPTVDFAGPILGSAGLIAITGPTGSGKSTLLDGLSLALFGCTPRLGKDTEELLSRDAVAGGAEATFVLEDGGRWIATWQGQRAHRSLDGKVRISHQVARAGDGAIVATGPREVKQWIEANLRLTYDQFKGVMLLAQFEFDRFLAAEDKDRSLLLEKLTGTDLYARLSSAAFEAGKVAQEKVQEHQETLLTLSVLSGEERAALAAAVVSDQAAVAATEASWQAAQTVAGWWGERRRLEDDLVSRRAAAALAGERWQAAAAERERLAIADGALPFQEALTLLDAARIHTVNAGAEANRHQVALATAEAERIQRQTSLAEAVAQVSACARGAATAATAGAALAALPDRALHGVVAAVGQRDERQRHLAQGQSLVTKKHAAATTVAERLVTAEARETAAVQLQREAVSAVEAATAVRTGLLAGRDPAALGTQVAEAHEALALARRLAGLDLPAAISAAGEAEARVNAAQEALTAAAAQVALALAQHGLAEQQKQRAESLARVAAFAGLLESGQPCPLCGSAEHPHPAVVEDAGVAEAIALLAQAAAHRRIVEAAATRAADALAAATTFRATAVATRDRLAHEDQQVRARWTALALPGWGSVPEVAAAEAQVHRLAERLAAIKRSDTVLLEAQEHQRNADGAAAQAQIEVGAARASAGAAIAGAEEAQQAVQAAEIAWTEVQQTVTDLVAELVQGLGEEIPADPVAWVAALPARVAAARALADQARMLAEAEGDHGAAARAKLPAGAVGELADVQVADPRQPIAALRREWDAYGLALGAVQRAAEMLQGATAAVEAARQGELARQAELQHRLGDSPFVDEAAVRGALLPPLRLTALRQQVMELQQAVGSSQAEVERATAALAGHLPLPGIEPADPSGETTAQATLQAAQQARDQAREHLAAQRQRLAEDQRKQEQRQRIEAEAGPLLAAATRAGQLSDLIGSKDGARFRRFAQALTLDHLLILANHRLISLTPRYRLARVPMQVGEDPSLGLEVIDQEQAEARRPAATLSGGETFLVSLALALALADLKRGGLHLGTLFIDEGFGSLDPATLERCLAILERLQQEQGTQIVVISHVGALHERLAHRIEVRPQGNGRSRLRISGPEGCDEGLPPVATAAAVVASGLDAEQLRAALPQDGTPISSRALRDALAWEPARFKVAVAELQANRRIEQPPGSRALRLVGVAAAAATAE